MIKSILSKLKNFGLNKEVDFDTEFKNMLTELVELAYEFVDNNSKEVDTVYVIGLIESGYFYNAFYKINSQVVEMHKVNEVSKKQYNISGKMQLQLLHLGNELLEKIETLFKTHSKEVPTMLKLIYNPKTGNFDSDFSYEKTFTNSKTKTAQDVYGEWFKGESK